MAGLMMKLFLSLVLCELPGLLGRDSGMVSWRLLRGIEFEIDLSDWLPPKATEPF